MAESQNRRPQIADESMANQTIGMDESMERSLQFSTSQNPVLKKKDQQASATLPDIKDPKHAKQKMRINPRETTDKKSPSVRTQKKGLSFFDTAKLLDPDMYEDSDLDITLTDFAKFKGWMSQKPAKKVHKLEPMPEVKASQDGSTDGKSRIPPPATKFVSNEPKRATSVGRSAPAESQPKVLPFPLDGPGSTSTDSKKKPWVPTPLPQKQPLAQPSMKDTGMSRGGGQLLDRYIDPIAPRTPVMTAEPPTQIPYKEDENPAFRAVVNNALPVEKNIREHMVSRYSKNGRSGTSLAAPKLSDAPLRPAPTGSRVGLAETKMSSTAKGADSRTKVSNEWLFGREATEETDPSRDRSFVAGPPQDPRKQALRYRVLDDFAGNWSPRNRIDMLYPREKDLDTDLEPQVKQKSPLSRYYLHSTPEATGGEYAFSVFNKTKPTIREHSQQETDRDREEEFDHRKIAKGILGRFIHQSPDEEGGGPEFQEDVDDGTQYGKERIALPAGLEGYSRDEFDEESDYEMKKAAEIRKKRVIEVAKLLHVDEIIKERQILDSMRLQLLEVQSKLQNDQRSLELERMRMLAPPEPEPVMSPRSGWITHYDPKPRIPLPKLTKTGKPVVSFAGFGKGNSIRYEQEFFQEEESRKSDEVADDDNSSDLGELEFEKYLIKFEELEELRRERAARKKARESLQKAQMREQMESQVSSRKPSIHRNGPRDGDSNPAFNNSINRSLKVDSDARLDDNPTSYKTMATTEPKNLKQPEQIFNVEEHNVSFNKSFKYLPVDSLQANDNTDSKTNQKSRITLKPLETPLLDQYAYTGTTEIKSRTGSPHNASDAYAEAFSPKNMRDESSQRKRPERYPADQSRDHGSKSILDPGSPVFVPILAALEPMEKKPILRPPPPLFESSKDPPPKMFYSEPNFYPEDPKVTVNSIRFKKNNKKKSTEEPIPEDFEELVITPEMITTPPPTVEIVQGSRVHDSDRYSMSRKFSEAAPRAPPPEKQQPLPPIMFVANEESRPAQPIPQRPVRLPVPLARHNSVSVAPDRPGIDRRVETVRGDTRDRDDGIRPPRVSSTHLQGRGSEANRLNESNVSSASRNQAVRSPQRIVMSKNQFMKNRANTHKRIPITDGGFDGGLVEAKPANADSITFSPPQLARTLQSQRA